MKDDSLSAGPPPPFTLAQALRAAADELAAQHPPADLQARLADAVRRVAPSAAAEPAARRPPPTPPRRSTWVWPWKGALAFAGAAALAGLVALLVLRPPAREALPPGVQVASLGAGQLGDFMPLVPADRWPRQAELAWVIDTELRRDRLAALGLPFDPARAGDSVPAQLLVHRSGEVLAVRFAH